LIEQKEGHKRKYSLSVMRFLTTFLLRLENHQLQHFIVKCWKQKYIS